MCYIVCSKKRTKCYVPPILHTGPRSKITLPNPDKCTKQYVTLIGFGKCMHNFIPHWHLYFMHYNSTPTSIALALTTSADSVGPTGNPSLSTAMYFMAPPACIWFFYKTKPTKNEKAAIPPAAAWLLLPTYIKWLGVVLSCRKISVGCVKYLGMLKPRMEWNQNGANWTAHQL